MTRERAPLRVLYVFRERKRPLLADWAAGRQPDTLLFGVNHLAPHGIEAGFYEPEYGAAGRAIARQVGRLGPDVLQVRALSQFRRHDVVFLTAGWPLLLLARRFLRQPPKLIWLNLSLETLLLNSVLRPTEQVPMGTGCRSKRAMRSGGRAGAPALARLRALLLRAALAQADRVVCVARSQQDTLRRALGFPNHRLPVVLSGVDAAFYTPAGMANAQVTPHNFGPQTLRQAQGRLSDFGPAQGYILAAGRDLGRDYATLLAAAGLDREIRIVAGPANLAGLNIPPDVHVEYGLPPAELRERYRGAACVVVPTHGDGYPRGSDCSGTLVMLDAMACARPVVVTQRRSIDDYLSPDREALTVPPGDAVALRQAVQTLLASPARARQLGAAGRQAVEERFNTRAMAGELAKVFFEVVA